MSESAVKGLERVLSLKVCGRLESHSSSSHLGFQGNENQVFQHPGQCSQGHHASPSRKLRRGGETAGQTVLQCFGALEIVFLAGIHCVVTLV